MYEIKQSTALTVPFFVHDASGDAVTGLSDGSFTKRISKNGAAFGAMTVTISELENGWYSIPLSATHSDTNGILTILFTNAGAKQVNLQWRVETKLVDDLNDLAQSDILSDATPFAGALIDASISSRSDFDETADPVELLDSGGTAGTSADELVDDVWDEVLTGSTHNVADSSGRRLRDLQEFGVYEGGAVWIDTINGSPGTTDFESGTAFNPVNNINDANTLAASLGLSRFEMAPGSSITLVASQENQIFMGDGWTLALGGQSVSGTHIIGATVSGMETSANEVHFDKCEVGTVTLGAAHLTNCSLTDTLTLGDATHYLLENCYAEVDGAGVPIIDYGVAVGEHHVNMRRYSGGIQVEAMGDNGADTLNLEGDGKFIEGTCTSGQVEIAGNFTVSGITNLTLVDDARIDRQQIADAAWDEAQAGHVGAGTFGLFLDAIVSGRAAPGDSMALTAGAVDDIWDEDIVAAHGGADSSGLLLRALGALISQRANNATLEELLGIADAVGRDMPEQVWLEGTRDLTALGFQLDTADFVAAYLDATLIAANAIGASQLATDAGQEIADRILARSLATGADGGRTVQDALRLLRNLRQIVAGTLTVMEEDDATPAWTAAVTTAAGNPVDSIDPA